MSLSFLPDNVSEAVSRLNYNLISEIRLRRGQPVIIEYNGEYKYINSLGVTDSRRGAITAGDIEQIFQAATGGCVYNYVEQIKSGFITVEHGIRIGIAGEYVTHLGHVQTVKNITSLSIRIPHNICGCSDFLFKNLFCERLYSTLIFSKPGLGKTTMLRDIAVKISALKQYNVLIYDERNEIAAIDGFGNGYDLGDRVDVIRCHNKITALPSAIRAMKPQVIITDELYGDSDIVATEYAYNCGIIIIASSHMCNRENLKKMPFDFFVELTGIGVPPVIYDKNFDAYSSSNTDDVRRSFACCK